MHMLLICWGVVEQTSGAGEESQACTGRRILMRSRATQRRTRPGNSRCGALLMFEGRQERTPSIFWAPILRNQWGWVLGHFARGPQKGSQKPCEPLLRILAKLLVLAKFPPFQVKVDEEDEKKEGSEDEGAATSSLIKSGWRVSSFYEMVSTAPNLPHRKAGYTHYIVAMYTHIYTYTPLNPLW